MCFDYGKEKSGKDTFNMTSIAKEDIFSDG